MNVLTVISIGINIFFFFIYVTSAMGRVKRREMKKIENKEKVLETIRILLEKQIDSLGGDQCPIENEEQHLQVEIAKYIKDFLVSELKNDRFTPHGLQFAGFSVIENVPEIERYYSYHRNSNKGI